MGKGLCVKGLDTTEISRKMEVYLAGYFKDFNIGPEQPMFIESILLHYDEVKAMIPAEHHHLFTDNCKFNGLSGYVTIGCSGDEAVERVVMLLMDEHCTSAYLLYLQEASDTGSDNIIIKDFVSYTGT